MEDTSWLYDLRPVNFIYKKDEKNRKQFGLIAEEVEEVAKHLCTYRDVNVDHKPGETDEERRERVNSKDYEPDSTLSSVNYTGLITPMLKEIQKLKKEIEDLKNLSK